VHLEWRELLDSTGHLKPREALEGPLHALGLRRDRTVIVYCTGGVRSAEAFWMLRALGFTDVRNFDGSWYEWSFDKTKPVAR
jgi:thiosulfate/3-mercaptopyruvate sulfurtransferase